MTGHAGEKQRGYLNMICQKTIKNAPQQIKMCFAGLKNNLSKHLF